MTYIQQFPRRLPAEMHRVIDGDTFVAHVDLGFRCFYQPKIRIASYDAPERGQPGWAESKAHLETLLRAEPLALVTFKLGPSFERWVAHVEVIDEFGAPRYDVATAMVQAGHGEAT